MQGQLALGAPNVPEFGVLEAQYMGIDAILSRAHLWPDNIMWLNGIDALMQQWIARHVAQTQSCTVLRPMDLPNAGGAEVLFAAIAKPTSPLLLASKRLEDWPGSSLPDLRSRLLGLSRIDVGAVTVTQSLSLFDYYALACGLRMDRVLAGQALGILAQTYDAPYRLVSALNRHLGPADRLDAQAVLGVAQALARETV